MGAIKRFVALIMALFLSLFIGSPAFAVESSSNVELRSCPEVGQTSVTATIANRNYHIGVGPIFRAGPGGTVTATTAKSYTVGVTSNISGSITAGQIAKASVSAGVSGAVSSTSSTSYQYSRDISPGRYGNMQYGNFGTRVNVKKTTIVAPCNVKVLASGSAVVPSSNVWGYNYWES